MSFKSSDLCVLIKFDTSTKTMVEDGVDTISGTITDTIHGIYIRFLRFREDGMRSRMTRSFS